MISPLGGVCAIGKLYQSTLAGWHCKEIFAILIYSCQDYYHPVTDAWRETVELLAVYDIMSPWVNQYFSCYARRASRGVEEYFHAIALHEYYWLAVPVFIAVTCWGTHYADYSDPPLDPGYTVHQAANRSRLSCCSITPLSPRVREVLESIGLVNLVYNCDQAPNCLLLLRRIMEIDWDTTYAGKRVDPAGRYLL